MHELSYSAALDMGIEPISYRSGYLDELGEGAFPGRLDALVWTKRKPALQALVNLDSGEKVMIVAFKKNSRPELGEYLGFRDLTPGQRINLVIDVGARGGLRPMLVAAEEAGQ